MKSIKKLLALALVLVMLSALSVSVFAATQTIGTAATGKGSITIQNAAIGIDYKVVKLFDATLADGGDGITYTGNIPDALANYFEKNAIGQITCKEASLSEAAISALKTWAEGQTATAQTAEGGATGSPLVFEGLDYGYYVVLTSQGDAAISVDSVNPNPVIYDKNSTPPINNYSKSVDEPNVYIGQTVTYTVTFATANFDQKGENAEVITSYILSDDFCKTEGGKDVLTDVTVTSIKVGDTALTVQQFDNNGQITIPWADGTGTDADPYVPKYTNGAVITITYTAVVADTAAVAGTGNKNTITITYTTAGDNTPIIVHDDETISTYALAIKKVNPKGEALSGATFQFPFYVKSTPDADDGAYIYAGTASGTGLTNEITTPDSGLIIVKGLKSGVEVTIKETAAPEGYNLAPDTTVTPEALTTTKTETTYYLDEDGKIVDTASSTTTEVKIDIANLAATPVLVVDQLGTEMPSTGGIGTTLFYIFGSILVLGAGVVLVTKRRVQE